MLNIQSIMKIKQSKREFFKNHPKAGKLLDDVNKKGFCKDQEIAIAVRYPDGTEYKAGIKVTDNDLELLELLRELTR